MSDGLTERYKARLAEWPTPIDELITDALIANRASLAIPMLGRVLGSLSATEGIDETTRLQLLSDAIAFQLMATFKQPHCWGNTYFGPWAELQDNDGKVITNPPRECLTAEVVETWRARVGVVTHPVGVARYADGAWDIAPLAGTRRLVGDARAAIDAYLTEGDWNRDSFDWGRRLDRAFRLAKSIKDESRTAQARAKYIQAACYSPVGAEENRVLLSAVDTLLEENTLPDSEVISLAEALQKAYNRVASTRDAYRARDYAERLIRLHRMSNDRDAELAIVRQTGSLYEQVASRASGMQQASLMRNAHGLYAAAGLREDAQRAKRGLEEGNRRSRAEMGVISQEYKISVADLEAHANETTAGGVEVARRRLAVAFLPALTELQDALKQIANNAPIQSMMPMEIIDSDTGNVHHVPAAQEDPDRRMAHVYRMYFAHHDGHYMRSAIDRFVIRYELRPEQLASFGEACGLFPLARRGLRARAFAAYLVGDAATFVHLIVPQFEHALRLLVDALGTSTSTSRDNANWRQLTLSTILNKQSDSYKVLLKSAGEDMCFYLRLVLTEDVGWNARDRTCHGLIDDAGFGTVLADRLFHVFLLLTLYDLRVGKVQKARSPER